MQKVANSPEAFAREVRRAEEVVSRYFAQREDRPGMGSIEIFGQRYILVRAASLSVEFFTLAAEVYGPGREAEAEEFARNILFDLAHAIGKSDARNFHAKMGLEDPIARLSADHRQAIVLREIEGLSYEEIAEVMKCSLGTVMSRLFYARKKLQEMLKDTYENPV